MAGATSSAAPKSSGPVAEGRCVSDSGDSSSPSRICAGIATVEMACRQAAEASEQILTDAKAVIADELVQYRENRRSRAAWVSFCSDV
jgi:hypothetical protein